MTGTLTTRTVESARGGKKRREIPDAHLPGLYLIVQPSGAKSWAVRYRRHGRTRKLTLGAYPAVHLVAARDLGATALRDVAKNRDPGHDKARTRAKQTDAIEDVVTRFVEQHCRRHNKPRTAEESERMLRKHVLPRWRGRTVSELRRRDVLDLIDGIVSDVTPKAGNNVLAVVRKMLNWCVERDMIPSSPCAGVKRPAAETVRDRVLNDDELASVLRAADQVGGPFGSLVKLLILTGARRNECAKMQWSELDLDRRLWTLDRERVKNDERHEVPLSKQAIAVIEATPRLKDSPYVLTTTGDSPSSGYAKGKRKLDALLPRDMPGWRLHDLRRTVATGLAKLGINLPVIEKVLNHKSGSFAGIVAVYQRHKFAAEKAAALTAWGRHVEELVNGKTKTANVVALGKRRR
jgi:integrase